MKRLILPFLFLFIQCVSSQDSINVDSIVENYPKSFKTPSILANLITSDFKNDSLKIKALYSWIVNNIDYSEKESGKFLYTYKTEDERIKKEKRYNDRLSKRVISRNEAVCQGYSVLFKKVSEIMDIKSGMINGFGKSSTNMIGRFTSNHAWNFVEINNKKYLLDCTWGKKGITNIDGNKYFIVNPRFFINGHYPNNFSHSLLDDKIDKTTFSNLPVVYKSKYSVFDIICPNNGKLKNGESYVFKFKWSENIKNIEYVINGKYYPINDFDYSNEIISFTISPMLKRGKELLIYINDIPFIDYKIIR